jgi:hypothetical protein
MAMNITPGTATRWALMLLAALLALALLLAAGGGFWYVMTKLPQRSGNVALSGLSAPGQRTI